MGFSHVQLNVSDVARSARWYCSVLSLVPYAEDLEIGYVALRHPSAKFVIVLTRQPQTTDGRTSGSPESLDHVAFSASDGASLRAWAEQLLALGIEHQGVVLEDGRPSLQLRDPDGIAIELVASA